MFPQNAELQNRWFIPVCYLIKVALECVADGPDRAFNSSLKPGAVPLLFTLSAPRLEFGTGQSDPVQADEPYKEVLELAYCASAELAEAAALDLSLDHAKSVSVN